MRAAKAIFLFLVSCAPPRESPDYDFSNPSSSTARMGFFAAGLARIDLDGDGDRDLVAANGNDWSPQPLTGYTLNEGSLSEYPSWYSTTNAHRHGLAVGDLDGDGRDDLVAAVHFGLYRNITEGGFEVFYGNSAGLQKYPEAHTIGAQAVNIALGDVDGDGDLDLALAALQEFDGTPGRARIHLNRSGKLDSEPAWLSQPATAADLRLTDINNDGFLDLLLAGTRTSIYYGGAGHFSTSPDWTAREYQPFSFAVDVEPGTGGPRAIVATANCPPRGAGACRPALRIYRPDQSDRALWIFDRFAPGEQPLDTLFIAGGLISGAITLDLKLRGLVAGGRVLTFAGLSPEPLAAATNSVVQELLPADLSGRCNMSMSMSMSTSERRAAFLLPERVIQRVRQVEINGRPLARWSQNAVESWTISGDTLTISPAVEPGSRVLVEYEASPRWDLILADGDPRLGNHVYLNRRSCRSGEPSDLQAMIRSN